MLYTENTELDYLNILTYINELTKSIGLSQVQIDTDALFKVCVGMREEFPHVDGQASASVFKKMGNFLAYFLAYAPIKSSFPGKVVKGLDSFNPNAFVGLEIAITCIENSTILFQDGTKKKIDKPIYLSDHSYADIIVALSTDKDICPGSHFHIYTVLLEQLTYKTNPDCQYTPQDEGSNGSSSYYNGKPIVYDPTKGDDLDGL